MPERLATVKGEEVKQIQFRCTYCKKAHTACVLPESPRIAKFHCRVCGRDSEIETRPSAMDAIEQEFDLRLDMKKTKARAKAFSIPRELRVVVTKFGKAALIG